MSGFTPSGALQVDDVAQTKINLNYAYADGSGASGTWGISITGNAANITGDLPSSQVTGDFAQSRITNLVTDLAGKASLSGSYPDPTWITSLSGSKISGNISGNAASITGNITTGQVTGLGTAATLNSTAFERNNGITDSNTTRTISTSDAGSKIFCTCASDATYTLDTDANQNIAAGSIIHLINLSGSANQILTVATAGGVTLVGANPVIGPGGFITLIKGSSANTWRVLYIYEKFTSTTNTFTGPWSVAQNNQYTVTRINNLINWDLVDASVSSTSANAATATNTAAIPARFRPSTNIIAAMQITSNVTQALGKVTIDTAGVMTIAASITGGTFSTLGVAAIFRSGAGLNWTI